jgi:hypothetical protein
MTIPWLLQLLLLLLLVLLQLVLANPLLLLPPRQTGTPWREDRKMGVPDSMGVALIRF